MSTPPPSRKPHPKVTAGGAAGAASIILVWALGRCGVDVPGEVAAAFATLFSVAGGYLKASA